MFRNPAWLRTLTASFVVLAVAMVGLLVVYLISHGLNPLSLLPASGDKPAVRHVKFAPDDTTFDDCKEVDYVCLEQSFGNVAYRKGPQRALRLLDERAKTDTNIQKDCHRIGHTIGAAALTRNHGDVGKSFAEGLATCFSGYYHGVLERAFFGVSTSDVSARVASICESTAVQRTMFLHFQCVHGLGHGLMLHTHYDLPRSLTLCQGLPAGWEGQACDGGAFMENQSSSYGVISRYLKKDDLIYPCNSVARLHKEQCYLMVTTRILAETGYDWKKTAEMCRTKVEHRWESSCFQSYGRDASSNVQRTSSGIDELCDIAGRTGRPDCIYGAIREVATNFHGGTEAARICTALRDLDQAPCWTAVGTVLGDLHNEVAARRDACAALTRRHRTDCFAGAMSTWSPRSTKLTWTDSIRR